jgi:hypothetical protein
MAKDKWGYTELYIIIANKDDKKEKIPLISYHNDGYTYIAHDDMREIVVDVETIVDEYIWLLLDFTGMKLFG